MHVIAFVSLEHFYAQVRLQLLTSNLQPPTWFLHDAGVVLDTSLGAELRGVAVGMGLSEARTMLAGDGHIEAWAPEPYRQAQERWLDLLSTFCDAIEPAGQHAAYADLTGHPNPEATAVQILAFLRERLGLEVR
ncbi:MAG TPA: hypothetical protein VKT78_04910, partial [Fimbriimonadaceae bacterium]|nr:hypothetical protein [Fimbriimonadaceae bacterium]